MSSPHFLFVGISSFRPEDSEGSTAIPTPQMPTKNPCDFNYMVAAVGTGVHYKTPIGPVRLDLGYNLNPAVFPVRNKTGTKDLIAPHIETLHRFNIFFSIGQTF